MAERNRVFMVVILSSIYAQNNKMGQVLLPQGTRQDIPCGDFRCHEYPHSRRGLLDIVILN